MFFDKNFLIKRNLALRPAEVMERIRLTTDVQNHSIVKAFYSSVIGGIVTHNSAMLVHVDNSNLRKCISIVDCLHFQNGHLHLLSRYVERFFKSARAAGVKSPLTLYTVEKTIIEACTASRTRDGIVYMCLLSDKACQHENSFSIQVLEEEGKNNIINNSLSLMTCSMPSEYGALAQIKCNFCTLAENLDVEAVSSGACQLVFLDVCGFVAHSMEYNFLLYTGDGRLLAPSFENSCADITVQRIIELVNDFLMNDDHNNRSSFEWLYNHVKSAEFVPSMRMEEICDLSKELFIVGNGKIREIHQWNDKWVGEQYAYADSELSRVLYTIMAYDKIHPGYDKSVLTPVPYSSLTLN